MERHSFRISQFSPIARNSAENCAFLQKFQTRKLGEMKLFYAVSDWHNINRVKLQGPILGLLLNIFLYDIFSFVEKAIFVIFLRITHIIMF